MQGKPFDYEDFEGQIEWLRERPFTENIAGLKELNDKIIEHLHLQMGWAIYREKVRTGKDMDELAKAAGMARLTAMRHVNHYVRATGAPALWKMGAPPGRGG